MAKIDLTKPSSTPSPLRMPAGRPFRAYLMLGLGAFDLLQRSPIGVVFIVLGCYLLLRGRKASVPVTGLGAVGTRRADEVMAPAPTALPDWWTVDQYRGRVLPVGDAAQTAFPLVDLQGQVTGAIARSDLDQVALTRTADVRLRDVARRSGPGAMVLAARDSAINTLAGPVLRQGAIAVVVDAVQRPLGVITRSEIEQAKQRTP